MPAIKNCHEIMTSRNIKSFRACLHATAVPLVLLDLGRRALGEAKRLWSSQRRLWFDRLKCRPRATPTFRANRSG